MKLLNKTVWAITPEMLQTMMTIAKQTNKSPEAVASQIGKEMKNTNAVSIRDGVAVIVTVIFTITTGVISLSEVQTEQIGVS